MGPGLGQEGGSAGGGGLFATHPAAKVPCAQPECAHPHHTYSATACTFTVVSLLPAMLHYSIPMCDNPVKKKVIPIELAG